MIQGKGRVQEIALVTGAFRLLARGCETVYQWSCASHMPKIGQFRRLLKTFLFERDFRA